MPLTIFDVNGSATRRERTQAAVLAAAKHLKEPYEGWIADPFRGGARLLISGEHGFQRDVGFAAHATGPGKLG